MNFALRRRKYADSLISLRPSICSKGVASPYRKKKVTYLTSKSMHNSDAPNLPTCVINQTSLRSSVSLWATYKDESIIINDNACNYSWVFQLGLIATWYVCSPKYEGVKDKHEEVKDKHTQWHTLCTSKYGTGIIYPVRKEQSSNSTASENFPNEDNNVRLTPSIGRT